MKSKRNVRLMYALALLQGMVFYAPVATLYRQAQGVSLFEITIIESISLALMIALEIPWGFAADRIGWKKTIVICNALYFISKLIFWKADSFAMFLAERLILSVVMAGLSGCDSAFLYSSAGDENCHRVFGIYSAVGTAGLVAAGIVFSAFIGTDYSLAGFLTVISYAVSMGLSLLLVETGSAEIHPERARTGIRQIIKELAVDKRFFLFLAAAMLLSESNQTITVFLSQVQYLKAGIPPGYMGYIYVLLTLGGLAAALSGRLTSHLGESNTVRALFAAAAISCAVAALTASPLLSVASFMILRMSASLFEPISRSVQNREVKTDARATMLSVYSSFINAGAVFTNLVFGRLADINISLALGLGAVFCAVGALLYSLWHKQVDKTKYFPFL